MFWHIARIIFALSWVSAPSMVAAQDLEYQFTMSVTTPAPIPGKPFTFTWIGGETTEVVYIVLNDYFAPTPNQNIIYGTTDILSNAPNNGSWTYEVPLNIEAGRHSFSIGYNPFQLSDQTDIFTILPSQTSAVSPSPLGTSTSNAAFQTYNGCGLPPLPDYTYTGYQPPCIVTTSGHVETLFPIVPASDSSSFFGSVPSSSSPPINTAFATGVFAQALQCPTPVTPSTTKVAASGTTTILSLVDCVTSSQSSANSGGICHTSGYTTFSISGTDSMCCPDGWATTPLNSELFCFTSIEQDAKRAVVEERQISTETLVASPNILVEISGLVFTSAGVVTHEAAAGTGSSLATSGSGSNNIIPMATRSVASASTSKSDGTSMDLRICRPRGILAIIGVLYYLI